MKRNNNAFGSGSVAHKLKDSPHDSSGEKSLVFQTPPNFKKKKGSRDEYSDSQSPRRTKGKSNPLHPIRSPGLSARRNMNNHQHYSSNDYLGREVAKRTHSSQKQLSLAPNELLIIDKKLTRPQQSNDDHSNASLSVKAHSPDINPKHAKLETPAAPKAPEVLDLDQKQFRLGLETQEAKKMKIKDRITF